MIRLAGEPVMTRSDGRAIGAKADAVGVGQHECRLRRAAENNRAAVARQRDVVAALKDDVRPGQGGSASSVTTQGHVLVMDTVPVRWPGKLRGVRGRRRARRVEHRNGAREVGDGDAFSVRDSH